MTPAEHAKAIEDAAVAYAETTHTKDSYGARQGLKAAIRAGVGAAPAAPDVAAELEEVKTVCAEAYQVVGVLLADAGRFDSPDGQKILDNLAEQRLRHTDVLPWASKAAPEGWRDHAEIYVGDGLFAICEWGDFDLVKGYKWNLSSKIKSGCNYAQAWDSHKTSERRQIRMHSLIMQTPVGMYVDHINGDGLDNRRSNLRVVTHQQNTFNQSQHGGTSGFKGVCFDSETGLWRAYIQANKKRLSLGRHGTEIEAAKAYDTAAKEYFGEYAKLNLN